MESPGDAFETAPVTCDRFQDGLACCSLNFLLLCLSISLFMP